MLPSGMRRADRLFQIIQILRRHRVATAALLADELEVSERTVYRDVRDLVLSGVPIEGEAGVGYVLHRGFDMPPLMFTAPEIEALVLGARTVSSWADPGLARAAEDALAKVQAVLPDRLKARVESTPLFAPGFHVPAASAADLRSLREAIDSRRKVFFAYTRADGEHSERAVRPLGLFFWGNGWSMAGWCELRTDFRHFRLERIEGLRVLSERFADERGRTIEDYLERTKAG